ncbi:ANTAR domain-containing protein [Rhodococcoides kyotonense]|uniref:ANTAR domain-containing protein n=1 Tax=Rhodococcoides kyotonense TaxID=398843 RepID=A0A239FCW3_9NOCA|nr:ANTAR domain-containing protein [Rhodococcus kyotonensis]SNS54605.1 ANTAR domain-containing protein [Rhodococcus kyotonensis]
MNDVNQRLARLARTMNERPELEGGSGVDEIVQVSARVVPGAQHAGFTIVEEGRTITTIASSHRFSVRLDEISQYLLQGPCLDWGRDNRDVVVVDDMATDTRWPAYRSAVLAETPVGSLLSLETFTAVGLYGTLNVIAEQANAFDGESIAVGMSCAACAAYEWARLFGSRPQAAFFSSLARQEIAELAKGMLMERHRIDADAASRLLGFAPQAVHSCNVCDGSWP